MNCIVIFCFFLLRNNAMGDIFLLCFERHQIPGTLSYLIFFTSSLVALQSMCIFLFLRDVWIRTQRAAAASRRPTTNLATHFPNLAIHFSLTGCVYTFHIGIMHNVLLKKSQIKKQNKFRFLDREKSYVLQGPYMCTAFIRFFMTCTAL